MIKAAIREHGSRGDKVLPFLLKFRDIVERLGHHLMIERMVAISEAGLWGAEVHVRRSVTANRC